VYEPLSEEEFNEALRDPERLNFPEVIIPNLNAYPEEKAEFVAPVQFEEREFSLAQAREAAGVREGDYSYWQKAGGWVLQDERRTVLVTPQGVSPLPRCDLRAFDLLDAGREGANFLFPEEGFGELVAVVPPHLEGPGYFDPGFTPVEHAKIPQVLERARELGLPLTVHLIDTDGLGAQNQLVVGADPQLPARMERARAGSQPQTAEPEGGAEGPGMALPPEEG